MTILPGIRKRPWLQVIGLYLSVSCVLTYLDSVAAVRDFQQAGGENVWEPVVWSGTSIFVICLLAFGVYRFAEASPIHRHNWPKRLGQHFAVSLLFSVVHIAAMVMLRKLIYVLAGSQYRFGNWLENFNYEYSKDVITYASIAVLSYTHLFWKQYTAATMKTLALEADLASLRLRRLQEQLRPHFLFNTLNHISSCMYEDVEKADRLLADLCTLLRYGLRDDYRLVVRLEEELRFLRLYLDLMNHRFSGKLDTEITVEPGLEQAQVPQFLLQPLVENAIQHGFGNREGEGQIKVAIRKDAQRLILTIEDDGCGLPPSFLEEPGLGLGLGNTRAVLERLYPQNHIFQLDSLSKGGACVRIEMPLIPSQLEGTGNDGLAAGEEVSLASSRGR